MADPPQQPTRPPQSALIHLCQWLWKQRRFVWGTVIFGLILNLIAGWLLTPLGITFSQTRLGSLLGHPLPFVLAGVGLLGLTGGLWLINRLYSAPASQQTSPRPQAVLLTREDRRRLLTRLRSLYQDYMKQSLWGMPRMELGLERTFEATAHPALSVSYRPAGIREAIAPSTPILEVYQEAGDGLLILGKPGAGKSTLLSDLALALTERAERDATQPPPVLVSLTSWAAKRLPLEQWLAEELETKYQIPPILARGWLLADQLLPLLDGLDEMAEEARSACIEKINTYRRDHPLPIVVSSRSAEYLSQERKLHLQSAIEVQPLTPQQVDGYLKGEGKPLAAVPAALRGNATLRGLLTTPLMLSVVMRVYRDKTVKDLLQLGSAEEQQQQVFEHYIGRMLERQTTKHYFTPQQTRHWLTWLASQLTAHQQRELYLEQLQPDWLPKRERAFYQWSVVLVFWLVFGLVFGLLGGLSNGLVFGLVMGLVFGLVFGLSGWLGGELSQGGLRFEGTKIVPVEALTWSWGTGLTMMSAGLVAGLSGELSAGLVAGLVAGLSAGLVGGLVVGLSSRQLTERLTLSPNEGIRRSVKSGLLILFVVLCIGLFAGLVFGLFFGLVFGLVAGLFFGQFAGLAAAVQHYILRFWLWQARCTPSPWRYVRFLEEATERILLQRVGGGYRFIHPLFQEYFASLGIGTPASTQSQPSSSPQP